MPPKKKVRRYPQICLIEMDEGRYYGDGVRDKMYHLQLVVVEKTPEEITNREIEATLKE
jgi:hypothetical protein